MKNTIISTTTREILYLGPTQPGKAHDFMLLKNEFPNDQAWFKGKRIWVDLGYQGTAKYYSLSGIYEPYKKPRKSKANSNPELTVNQKQTNKRYSSIRVFVEHTIGGMKVFSCLAHRFRNWSDGAIDTVAALSAGLWNLKIIADQ